MMTVENIRTGKTVQVRADNLRDAVALAWTGRPNGIPSPYAPVQYVTDFIGRKLSVRCGEWMARYVSVDVADQMIEDSLRIEADLERERIENRIRLRRERRKLRRAFLVRQWSARRQTLISLLNFQPGRA